MCVLSTKVPIRKKSGNLFNDLHSSYLLTFQDIFGWDIVLFFSSLQTVKVIFLLTFSLVVSGVFFKWGVLSYDVLSTGKHVCLSIDKYVLYKSSSYSLGRQTQLKRDCNWLGANNVAYFCRLNKLQRSLI